MDDSVVKFKHLEDMDKEELSIDELEEEVSVGLDEAIEVEVESSQEEVKSIEEIAEQVLPAKRKRGRPRTIDHKAIEEARRLFEINNRPDLQAQLMKNELRYKCLTDLYFLASEVLGYNELSYEVHGPICKVVEAVNPVLMYKAKHRCPLYSMEQSKDFYRKYNLAHKDSDWEVRTNINGIVSYEYIDLFRLKDYVQFGEGLERLFLLHRGSFKTTLLSIAHTIQLLLIWPEIRILINSHKKEGGSQPILGSVRTHFKANKKLRYLFPEYCPKPNGVGIIEFGTQDNVNLPNRLSDCPWPESNVEVAGLTTDVTGRHYDYIKNDDLVTKDSVTNESMIQKTRDFKSLQTFLFEQPEWGITDNIGTIYHFNDLWCDLDKRNITKIKMKIWNNREEKKIIFSERFSPEGVEKVRRDIGDYEFSTQYEMNPIPEGDQTFKPEWLERLGFIYTKEEIKDRPLRISIYIDPASKRRKKSDYTAWIVIGVDDKGTKFLLDAGRDKLQPEDRTNMAFDLAVKWNQHRIYYETVGFQDTDKYIIEKKSRERKYHITIEEITASVSSKEDRIRGLQPIYERGDIRWPSSIQYFSKYENRTFDAIQLLRDELLMFPKLIHDDMADCHSFMLSHQEYNASKVKVKQDEDTFEQLQDIVKKIKNPTKSFYASKGLSPLRKRSYSIPSRISYLKAI